MGLIPTLPRHLGTQYHKVKLRYKGKKPGHDLSCAGGPGGLLLSLCFLIVLPIHRGQERGERVVGCFS